MPKLALQDLIPWFRKSDDYADNIVHLLIYTIQDIFDNAAFVLKHQELYNQLMAGQKPAIASSTPNIAVMLAAAFGAVEKISSPLIKTLGTTGVIAAEALDITADAANLLVTKLPQVSNLIANPANPPAASAEKLQFPQMVVNSYRYTELLKRFFTKRQAAYKQSALDKLINQVITDFAEEAAILLYVRHALLLKNLSPSGLQYFMQFLKDSVNFYAQQNSAIFNAEEDPIACFLAVTYPESGSQVFYTDPSKTMLKEVEASVAGTKYVLRNYFCGTREVIDLIAGDIYKMDPLIVLAKPTAGVDSDSKASSKSAKAKHSGVGSAAAPAVAEVVYPAITLFQPETARYIGAGFAKNYGVADREQTEADRAISRVYLAYDALRTIDAILVMLNKLSAVVPNAAEICVFALDYLGQLKQALTVAHTAQTLDCQEIQQATKQVLLLSAKIEQIPTVVLAADRDLLAKQIADLTSAVQASGPWQTFNIAQVAEATLRNLTAVIQFTKSIVALEKSTLLQNQRADDLTAFKKVMLRIQAQILEQQQIMDDLSSQQIQTNTNCLKKMQRCWSEKQLQQQLTDAQAQLKKLQDMQVKQLELLRKTLAEQQQAQAENASEEAERKEHSAAAVAAHDVMVAAPVIASYMPAKVDAVVDTVAMQQQKLDSILQQERQQLIKELDDLAREKEKATLQLQQQEQNIRAIICSLQKIIAANGQASNEPLLAINQQLISMQLKLAEVKQLNVNFASLVVLPEGPAEEEVTADVFLLACRAKGMLLLLNAIAEVLNDKLDKTADAELDVAVDDDLLPSDDEDQMSAADLHAKGLEANRRAAVIEARLVALRSKANRLESKRGMASQAALLSTLAAQTAANVAVAPAAPAAASEQKSSP